MDEINNTFNFGELLEKILIVIVVVQLYAYLFNDFKFIKAKIFGLYVLLIKVLLFPFIVLINTRNRIIKDKELEKDYETDFLTIYFQKQIFDALIIFSWPVLLVMFFYSIFKRIFDYIFIVNCKSHYVSKKKILFLYKINFKNKQCRLLLPGAYNPANLCQKIGLNSQLNYCLGSNCYWSIIVICNYFFCADNGGNPAE